MGQLVWLGVVAVISLAHCFLIEPRIRRQTVVSSNSDTYGLGDVVETDAMSQHYKTADQQIGMNVSSSGNATGANSASITNQANALNSTGNVGATGDNSMSFSGIEGAVYGNDMMLANSQQGKADGTGDTSVVANAGNLINLANGTQLGGNQIGTAGATGSKNSSSEILSIQNLTWNSLLAQLIGSASAQGLGNAQANVDLGSGTQDNGVEVNGLVSGWNGNNGDIDAQVNGQATMNGTSHELTGNMQGSAQGKGNTTLVGATNLNSNSSGTNQTINAFGDANIKSDGDTSVNLGSSSQIGSAQNGQGNVILNATADAANKDIQAQNGLKINDQNGGTLAIANGNVNGQGTVNSGGSVVIDSQYNSTGDAHIESHANGNSIADNNNNATLTIGGGAQLNNTNVGQISGSGMAFGENTNVTGDTHLNVGGSNTGGAGTLEAFGGGFGPSAVETNVALNLTQGDEIRNSSVQGGVSASGDKTQVHSISTVTDENGVQTMNNYQHATSISNGSSSASASNSIILRRKKRSAARLGVLFDALF